MAQRSKKDQISEAALTLFLEHGVKGTSIDMVVKSSGVSKPTVYNHFPDKANLLSYVIEQWHSAQPSPGFKARTEQGLLKELPKHWFNDTAIKLYALFIGEGFRAPDAKSVFLHRYDQAWRSELSTWARHHHSDVQTLNGYINALLLQMLLPVDIK